MSRLLTTAAKQTFGLKSKRNAQTQQGNPNNLTYFSNKSWFTKTCHRFRKKYHAAKKQHNQLRTLRNYTHLKNMSRKYKQSLDHAINQHRSLMQTNIKHLRKNNSKEFWKIINKDKKKDTNIQANLDELFYHFRTSCNADNPVVTPTLPTAHYTDTSNNEILNSDITENEVKKAILKLKNGKAAGDDNVLNEYIKCSADIMIQTYTNLFNEILHSGIYPSAWSLGTVVPIFKNKGNPKDPKNYRPITLSSTVGKLFSIILNERLQYFLEIENIIKPNQGAFVHGSSTVNHIFALHLLIDYAKNFNKTMYCAFLDLSSAYDTVWRDGLFLKLFNSGIQGKFLDVIKSMYSTTKSYIRCNNRQSSVYSYTTGIKQGCNLSCLFFVLYLNDLEEMMLKNSCNGVHIINQDDGMLMLNMFLMLYADDTVLISTNAKDMQHSLNIFNNYCHEWKLKINEGKSKIVIFGKSRGKPNFSLNDKNIEITNRFKYLGIVFSKNGRFVDAIKNNLEQARKSFFSITKRAFDLNLSVSCQLHMLNTIVKPILLYGCEIFCFENISKLEQFYCQCLRSILKVNRQTPSYMVYGDTGCMPLYVDVLQRSLSFYMKNKFLNVSNLSSYLMIMSQAIHNTDKVHFRYLEFIKNNLDSLGCSSVFTTSSLTDPKITLRLMKQRVKDQYLQKWNSDIDLAWKAYFYRIIKTEFKFEQYLDLLDNRNRVILTKFRTSNHYLPIEKGRWYKTPRHLRTCPLCPESQLVGDEIHYLLFCPKFNTSHTQKNIYHINKMFNSTSKSTLLNTCHIVEKICANFEK